MEVGPPQPSKLMPRPARLQARVASSPTNRRINRSLPVTFRDRMRETGTSSDAKAGVGDTREIISRTDAS